MRSSGSHHIYKPRKPSKNVNPNYVLNSNMSSNVLPLSKINPALDRKAVTGFAAESKPVSKISTIARNSKQPLELVLQC